MRAFGLTTVGMRLPWSHNHGTQYSVAGRSSSRAVSLPFAMEKCRIATSATSALAVRSSTFLTIKFHLQSTMLLRHNFSKWHTRITTLVYKILMPLSSATWLCFKGHKSSYFEVLLVDNNYRLQKSGKIWQWTRKMRQNICGGRAKLGPCRWHSPVTGNKFLYSKVLLVNTATMFTGCKIFKVLQQALQDLAKYGWQWWTWHCHSSDHTAESELVWSYLISGI